MLSPENTPPAESEQPVSERLDGWKEIARYLGKAATTVRRWEREEGLPVRRMEHLKRGSIIAYPHELDAWLRTRAVLPENAAPRKAQSMRWLLAGAGVGCLGVLALVPLITRNFGAQEPLTPEIRVLTADRGFEAGGTLSPGARSFAYVGNAKILYVKQVGVEPPAPIFSEQAGMILHPAWSPDGNWIALARTSSEKKWEMMLISKDGKARRSLGPGGPANSWMPDGRRILFAHRAAANEPAAIFELDIASGQRRQVSFPPSGWWGDIAAAPSADGKRLVLVRYSSMGNGDVYTGRLGESAVRQLTRSGTWILGAAWSPDNRRIIFGGTYKTLEGLFLLPADGGSEPVRITGTEGRSVYPRTGARPDGSWLITYGHEGWDTNLKVFDTLSREVREVAATTRIEESPDLTADGKALVFISGRAGLPNLWVCRGECLVANQITFSHELHHAMSPSWSPDGKSVVYCARAGGQVAILRIGSGGENQRVLQRSGYDDSEPAWSRDGKWIYFRSNRSGSAEIWRIPSEGGGARQVTRGGGVEASESEDGQYLYVLKGVDRAPLKRHSLADGSETPVAGLPLIRQGFWKLAGSALYYFDFENQPGERWPIDLCRLDLASGERRVVLTLADHRLVLRGLAADGTGRRLMWSERVSDAADIYAVDFH